MEAITKTAEETADNELAITRILNAPIELVWEVWTDPKHIAQWWGPIGFSTTIQHMEVKEGGEWDMVMHGPDGVEYKNKNIFSKVIKPELIVFKHVTPPIFTATITFKKQDAKTELTMKMVFESATDYSLAINKHGAKEGQKQTIARLKDYVENI
jgi:uncharacterized protein YndB with AHSA1/START domain